jgi:hypothetical protein
MAEVDTITSVVASIMAEVAAADLIKPVVEIREAVGILLPIVVEVLLEVVALVRPLPHNTIIPAWNYHHFIRHHAIT